MVLQRIRHKYDEYKIKWSRSYVADAGTYGMGIMSVKDPAEVRDLNTAAAQ
jgi:glutamate--cysteine ligase